MAMWLTENPMMPPTQSSSVASVTREHQKTHRLPSDSISELTERQYSQDHAKNCYGSP
jgi:hypothetical protein